ncbi:BsuPI-related putative proteinase inhibitor [Chryseomicrobium palamuruense]|uniref:Intracellular proteinase inhibitor BsuPI domain-containing protein n=1 Tax=Chryseomicrobium palamuruense TaxID=682973 RepID=A0ABV8UU74_9BACL
MKKWILIILAALVMLLAACGSMSNQTTGAGEEMPGELSQQIKEQDGEYFLVITNDTNEDVTLTFTSGQLFEYQLIDDTKEPLFTYSMNKMFTQALTEQVVAAGKTWELPLDITTELSTMQVPAGTYQLDVWSLAEQFEGEKVTMNDFMWSGE